MIDNQKFFSEMFQKIILHCYLAFSIFHDNPVVNIFLNFSLVKMEARRKY